MLPPRSILVAVDFSDASRAALALAARLARRCGARLHVLHVVDPMLAAAAAQQGVNLIAETREALKLFVPDAPVLGEHAPCIDVVIGGAAHDILTIAARESVDLVVLATHGMTGARRLLGSVAQQVLMQAGRSILLVPGDWPPPADASDPGLGPLVVGIDCSVPSVVAARAACRLATDLGTTTEALHVVTGFTVPHRWTDLASRAQAERVDLARRDVAQFAALSVPALGRTGVCSGDVAESLAAAAAPSPTRRPLLVVGRRGATALGDVPGATAQRLAMVARAPVLVVQESHE